MTSSEKALEAPYLPPTGDRVGVYCLTADPIHLGHIQVIHRALEASFDKVIIGVAGSTNKTTMFDLRTRLSLANKACAHFGASVEVVSYTGSTVDFAHQHGARTLIRGMRVVADFQYEADMARVNRKLSRERYQQEIDTIFILANQTETTLSSSMIRELALLGCTYSEIISYVPPHVATALLDRMNP